MTVIKIFVSHSHADDGFCREFVSTLRRGGTDVWYDEHNLGTGELHEVIPRELNNRTVFIVILSKSAFRSSWVKDESRWAYNLFKRQPSRIIIPVTAETISERDFDDWLFLEDFKRIEKSGFRSYTPHVAAQKTLQALSIKLGNGDGRDESSVSGTVEDIITRGKALQAQDRPNEALRYWEVALATSSGSYQVWFNLGVTLFELNRHKDALGAFNQAVLINPSSVEALNNKGMLLARLKRYDEALRAYSDAVMFDSEFFTAWFNLGNLLTLMKRYTKAVDVFKKCLQIDGKSAKSWNNLGVVLSHLRRDSEAVQAFSEATTIERNNPRYLSNLANCLEKLGRRPEAELARFKARKCGRTGN